MEESTEENSKMIRDTAKENLDGRMEEFTMASGRTASSMALAISKMMKALKREKVSGTMERELNG